jgi:hypothetical protein
VLGQNNEGSVTQKQIETQVIHIHKLLVTKRRRKKLALQSPHPLAPCMSVISYDFKSVNIDHTIQMQSSWQLLEIAESKWTTS